MGDRPQLKRGDRVVLVGYGGKIIRATVASPVGPTFTVKDPAKVKPFTTGWPADYVFTDADEAQRAAEIERAGAFRGEPG